MGKSTTVELVQELEKRNVDSRYDQIIAEAKEGEFHDFKNNKYATPKIALVGYLDKFPELTDIKKAVIAGEYDE